MGNGCASVSSMHRVDFSELSEKILVLTTVVLARELIEYLASEFSEKRQLHLVVRNHT